MRRTISSGLFVIASWLVAPLWSYAAPATTSLWEAEAPLLGYSTLDGMSQGDVVSVAQDRSGHLWLATYRGLNRYDGIRFTTFTKADGLLHNYVTAIYAADNGRVWFSDVNGTLLTIDHDEVNLIIPVPGFESRHIIEISEFNDQLILATAASGVFAFSPMEPGAEPVLIRSSEKATHDVTVREGVLWFVQDGTVYSWSGQRSIAPRKEQEGVLHTTKRATGSFWLINTDHQIMKWSDGEFVLWHPLEDGPEITHIASGTDDSVWIGTVEGIARYREVVDPDTGSRVGVSDVQAFSETTTLFVDRENTLWLGRFTGFFRYLGNRFEHFKNSINKNESAVWSIAEDSVGNFYFATSDGVFRRQPNGEAVNYSALLEMPEGEYRDLSLSADGTMYFASSDHGVFAVDIQSDSATFIEGTQDAIILDTQFDATGGLWVATAVAGIMRIDTREQWAVQTFEETKGGEIYTLTIDDNGSVWYGVDGIGLGVLRPQNDGTFNHDFYGAESGLEKMLYSHIVAVGDEQLWLGGEDSLLAFFDRGKLTDYSTISPLRDQNVYAVFPQDDGSLLLGGEQGVFWFNPDSRESYSLGLLEGFLGMEVNAHALFLDSRNDLWFGTIDGPTRMDLDKPLPKRIALEPSVHSAKIESTTEFLRNGQSLTYNEHDVQIFFDDISLREPLGVQYSYRLVGKDYEWSKPSRDRVVNYSGLAPGSYRFEVRARYVDGRWFNNSNALMFHVRAPFWQTPLFLFLVIAGTALVLYSGVWLRTSSIERLNRRLREEVDERTRSIEEGRAKLLESNRQLRRESEERRRANLARAEVEKRFRIAFQSTPIGMALIDAKARILNSNQALREMFLAPDQRSNEQVTLNALSFVDEEAKSVLSADFKRLMNGAVDSFDAEYKCHRFDGEVLYTHMFFTAIRDDHDQYKYCVAQVQDITESRRLTDALEYQANYDELSGLLNRRSFENALDRAFVQSRHARVPSYLMFMDLDQFKVVNDTSGHSAGDELLRQVSELIREQVRNDDTVGRLGGDEFGLILWSCPTNVAYRIAESIRSAVEDFQFQWGANMYRVGVSIGAVMIDHSLGNTAEIQQLADAACYHSKDNGRNRVHFVQGQGESINEHRGEVRWVQRLHEAMDTSNFALYGQFIKPVDPESLEPERMEVLLRMREPQTRKVIPPGAFLPAAERYGLITKLDQWVVENLLRMLYVHQVAGCQSRRYWVNLSGTSVGDKRFVDFLIDAVKTSGLPEGMINFEITETAVIRNVGEAGRLMSALHDEGCQFALDDFGSGLSSFGYLKKLPVDSIKIDGMFVRDILTDDIDRVFVRSIIDISRTMGIKSIAEFVENKRIFEAVRDLGVDYVQGFGVHRPEALFADLTNGALVGPAMAHNTLSELPGSSEKLA